MRKRTLDNKLDNINEKILIYGAHLIALECCRFFIAHGKRNNIVGIAVTNKKGNPKEVEGFPVKEISEYKNLCKKLCVIIAMPEKYHTTVQIYAEKLGFVNFIKLGLEEMSLIKGRQLLLELKRNPGYSFVLEESDIDNSWMNIRTKKKEINHYYKFPTLFYKNIEDIFNEVEKKDIQKQYQDTLGLYRNLHQVLKKSKTVKEEQIENIIKVFMAFSKGDSTRVRAASYHSWICPLQLGGRDIRIEMPCLYDDIGESIADKNSIFAEMTGAYWIWKNINNVVYKGLCHYRRHFIITESEINTLEKNGVDVILTTARYVPFGIGSMFLEETPVKKLVFESLYRALHECSLEDEDGFRNYMKTCFYYPNNMVIARNEIYNDYCEWIFRILFRMLEIDIETDYGHINDRHIAYAAELLTSWYFVKHKEKYCITVTDYEFYS